MKLEDGSVWPDPYRAEDVEWCLRYQENPWAIRMIAAAYVSAYRELVMLPTRERNKKIAMIRKRKLAE